MKKILALDVRGTNTRIALVNQDLVIEQLKQIPTVKGNSGDFLDSLLYLIESFDLSEVSAISAGFPGLVDRNTGYIYSLTNLKVGNIPFGDIIKEKFNKTVYVRNDAELACLAESYLGAGQDYERVFYFIISLGLGGALVVDKEIQDYVTEIGLTEFTYNGKQYEYEWLASGQGIINLARMNGLIIKDAKEFFELVNGQNTTAISIYLEWQKIISQFIEMIENSYKPDAICVTGGVMKAKKVFYASLLADNPHSNIIECKVEEHAGVLGATIHALKMMKSI